MSFVKKALKKVFKVVKKVVKSKVFMWVAIAAAIFFTAGVAAGGFAAFAGVKGVGTFFVAVGQTMATGAASMASAVGFKSAAAGLAKHGGAAAIHAGLTETALSATGAQLTALGSNVIATDAAGKAAVLGKSLSSKAILKLGTAEGASAIAQGSAQTLASSLGVTNAGSLAGSQLASAVTTVVGGGSKLGVAGKVGMSAMVWQGIQTGFTAMAAAQARKTEKKGPTFVAGGLSHGGSTSLGPQPFFVVGGPRGANAPVGAEVAAPQAPATQEATVAGTLARESSAEQSSLQTTGPTEPGGLLSVSEEGPARLPETRLAAENIAPPPEEGGGIISLAQGADVEADPLSSLRATNIVSPRSKRPLEDRIAGGIIAGV